MGKRRKGEGGRKYCNENKRSCSYSLLPSCTSMCPKYFTCTVLEYVYAPLVGGVPAPPPVLAGMAAVPAVSLSGCRGSGIFRGWEEEGAVVDALSLDCSVTDLAEVFRWKIGDFF